MNTIQTEKSNLVASLQVNVVKADYEEEVNKALKDYQRKANLPGFRPGKVPFSMIKRMYGSTVFMEKLNKKVSEALNKHIIDNKLDVIGYPLPDPDKTQPEDPENQEELNFYFEIGMRPTFDVNLKEINIDSYRITPSEDEIEKTIKSIQDNNKIEEQPAELNEELFEKIFPGKEIKTLEAFKAKVAEEMKIQYIVEENRMFLNRAIDLLVENVKFDMPDTFIRRWIVENSEGKITPEDVEKNYESIYSKSFRWQLIEEALLKIEPGLIIKEEETRAYATRAFFPHIDPATIDDEMKKQLDGIIDSLLKDEKQRQNINNQLADNKLTQYLKANMNVTVKECDYDGFVKAILPKEEKTEA